MRDNIDITIQNDTQAIIIENKIQSGDQNKQLERYFDSMTQYYQPNNITVLYLTPSGWEPSKQSLGNVPRDRLRLASYEYNIPVWIKACISSNEILKDSKINLTQYLEVVYQLTTHDEPKKEAHVMDIKEILSTGDNFILAGELHEAIDELKVDKLVNFFNLTDKVLHDRIPDLPKRISNRRRENFWDLSTREHIEDAILGPKRQWTGLTYWIDEDRITRTRDEEVTIGIGGAQRLGFGINCVKADEPELHKSLSNALGKIPNRHSYADNPWWRFFSEENTWKWVGSTTDIRGYNEATLGFLSLPESDLIKFIEQISITIEKIWHILRDDLGYTGYVYPEIKSKEEVEYQSLTRPIIPDRVSGNRKYYSDEDKERLAKHIKSELDRGVTTPKSEISRIENIPVYSINNWISLFDQEGDKSELPIADVEHKVQSNNGTDAEFDEWDTTEDANNEKIENPDDISIAEPDSTIPSTSVISRIGKFFRT